MTLRCFSCRPAAARLLAAFWLGCVLTSCAVSGLPRVALATPRLAVAEEKAGAVRAVRDDRLAARLQRAWSAGDSAPTGLTEEIVLALQRQVHPHDWKGPIRIEGRAGTWSLSFEEAPQRDQGAAEWTPSMFDRVIPASAFKLDVYGTVVARPGAGAPVVLGMEDVEKLRSERAFRPSNGAYVPGTAVLDFGKARHGHAVPVRLRIYNSVETLQHEGRPLAANITAAVQANLDNTYVVRNGLLGLFRPDRRVNDVGLFGILPYDPDRIPVVFVHGLNSSPAVWRNAVNAIYADAELRDRYQPMLFLYPTGLNVPDAAGHLRQSLDLYRDRWDPSRTNPNFRRMVIVGHSMGGLLTRLQVSESGDDLQRAFFTCPLADLPWLTRAQEARISASLFFEPRPFVSRVVFIATPHRGSSLADLSLVRLMIRLIHLPPQTAAYVGQALTGDPALLNPALMRYKSMGLRSVDMLSPSHPYFKAINKHGVKVPYHSIIGDRGKPNAKIVSDGVVPYVSSHLDGAESEKIVPHGHSCTMDGDTVTEIMRVLRAHERGSGRP